MPRLVGLCTYRDAHGGPDFSFMEKCNIFCERGGSELEAEHIAAENLLKIAINSGTGVPPVGLAVNVTGARALRDYLTRFCDQMADLQP